MKLHKQGRNQKKETHLKGFVEVDHNFGGVAREEDHDNGHEEPGHGAVPPVAGRQAVVGSRRSRDRPVDAEVEDGEEEDRKQA